MQAIPYILIAASAAMGAKGQMEAGKAQQAQYEASARANEYSAAVARQKADSSRQIYGQREEQQRRSAALALGKQQAASAQSGLGLGGTSADELRQSEVLSELDALNIKYEGELAAGGYLQESTMRGYEAESNIAAGKSAMKGARLGAASTVLSSAGKMYGMSKQGGA